MYLKLVVLVSRIVLSLSQHEDPCNGLEDCQRRLARGCQFWEFATSLKIWSTLCSSPGRFPAALVKYSRAKYLHHCPDTTQTDHLLLYIGTGAGICCLGIQNVCCIFKCGQKARDVIPVPRRPNIPNN